MAPRKGKGLVLLAVHGRKEEDLFTLKPDARKGLESCIHSRLLFFSLKRHLEGLGYRVGGIDKHDMAEADHIVFFDAWPIDPRLKEFRRRRKELRARVSLVLVEPPVTNHFQYKPSTLRLFDRVLTYDPTMVDGTRFFRYHYPANVLPRDPFKVPFTKRRFLCMTGANKYSVYPTELYSERKRSAEAFEGTPEGVDVYGSDWDRPGRLLAPLLHIAYRWRQVLPQVFRGDFRRLKYVWEVTRNTRPFSKGTYKGRSELPIVTLYSKYRFALCFENGDRIPGYASERLYDCMNARCVPIYLGDTEILKQVPSSCFIDMRKFRDYAALYRYLRSIDAKRYAAYVRSIDTYLRTAYGKPRSIPHFCKEFSTGLLRK